MYRVALIFLLIFLPLVVGSPLPLPQPSADPEIVRYAAEVGVVWQGYQDAAAEIGRILAKLAADPLFIRQTAFTDQIKGVTVKIRQNTNYLASVHSPEPVEGIHETLVQASDIFDASAYMLVRFGEEHDFDDFATAYELLRAGLALWQQAMADLTELVGPM